MIVGNKPFIFDEFFASGKEESISPFLTKSSKAWSKNLTLKSSILAAFLLLISFSIRNITPSISDALLVFVYFLVGTPALIDTIEDIRNLEINIDVLMTLAALLSVVIGSGFEGALLLVLFEVSAAMENTVTRKTKGALSTLHELSPNRAFVIDDSGQTWEKSTKDITVGTIILVKAGEIVPLDSRVIAGSSYINLSHLTGESIPISKKAGDEVQAGARNLDGTLTLEVLRVSADSTLTRIMQLITHAQETKPQLQRFIDKFGDKYAIAIILLSVIFALILPLMDSSLAYFGTEGSIYRSLTFLIAASPCALVIATPTAYLSSISSCARKGILLKGGIILDAISKCRAVAFDKTGTLTTGKLKCTLFSSTSPSREIIPALSIAASVEQHVIHPIADAFLNYAKEQNAPLVLIEDFKSIPGFGVQAKAQYKEKMEKVFIGHYGYVSSNFSDSVKEKLSSFQEIEPTEGKVISYILIGDELFYACFSDEIKQESVSTIKYLAEKFDIDTSMLTGDHQENAKSVGLKVGIQSIYSDLRPEDKLKIVADLSKEKGLIMVGDGINDAPALLRATVGISMGKIGSATAIDASDVVFLQDDLSCLEWLIHKSHSTLSVIKQNLCLALGVICLATSPAILGLVPLWAAVLLHEGGTVLVGLNSLRLLKK
ncbi:MAG: cation-translocating P-type ATPase [Chlamydiae bacterium]|nr:cation-translocating P-type ATPase [Chlamydiota bacterium]